MRGRGGLLVAVWLLSGACIAADVKLAQDERVGYLVSLRDTPIHRHLGPAGGDVDRAYPYDLKLTRYMSEQLGKKLQEAKFRPVDLGAEKFALEDVENMVVAETVTGLNGMNQEALHRLAEMNVRTVLVFRSTGAMRMTRMNCSNVRFKCDQPITDMTTGLFTEPRLPYFMAVTDIRTTVYVLDPPTILKGSLEFERAERFLRNTVNDFRPRDIKAISEEEWQVVAGTMRRTIDKIVEAVVYDLSEARR